VRAAGKQMVPGEKLCRGKEILNHALSGY
jgi:hypothetical protein